MRDTHCYKHIVGIKTSMILKTFKYFTFFILMNALASCSSEEVLENAEKPTILENGYWQGNLVMQGYDVPFIFHVDEQQNLIIFNSDEKIKMQELNFEGDSTLLSFQDYPTYIKFKKNEENELNGYYIHPDIGSDLQYPFHGKYIGKEEVRQGSGELDYDFSGNWETYFRPNTDRQYPSVGQFRQEGKVIKGTFLKPSGDARFLEGTFENNVFKLSSFDGSYAALYLAELKNDTLFGKYISRNTGEIEWFSVKNDEFELEDSDKRTFLVHNEIQLNLKTLQGESFTYPNPSLEGKTVIIQILGTWCPNCLDEGDYFKELYEKYQSQGLEIIGVAYERPTEFEDQVARVERMVKSRELPYPILIGGDLKSNKIAEDFSMLNKISAFPTALFINKKGEIVRVETGFSGPGTGELYEKHTKEITRFVEELLEL